MAVAGSVLIDTEHLGQLQGGIAAARGLQPVQVDCVVLGQLLVVESGLKDLEAGVEALGLLLCRIFRAESFDSDTVGALGEHLALGEKKSDSRRKSESGNRVGEGWVLVFLFGEK